MTELEYYHFATYNIIVDLGKLSKAAKKMRIV